MSVSDAHRIASSSSQGVRKRRSIVPKRGTATHVRWLRKVSPFIDSTRGFHEQGRTHTFWTGRTGQTGTAARSSCPLHPARHPRTSTRSHPHLPASSLIAEPQPTKDASKVRESIPPSNVVDSHAISCVYASFQPFTAFQRPSSLCMPKHSCPPEIKATVKSPARWVSVH